MSAAQKDSSKDTDVGGGGFWVALNPTKEERTDGRQSIFTSHGNRVVLSTREFELCQESTTNEEESLSEEHRAAVEKIKSGFRSRVDDRMAAFKYDALPNSSSIRLLRIAPAADDGMIRLSMETHDLNHGMPSYDCLSYTWGNPHARLPTADFYAREEAKYGESALWPVQCNGQLLRIRRNLFDALRQIPGTRIFAEPDEDTDGASTTTESDGTIPFRAQVADIKTVMAKSGSPDAAESGQKILSLAASKGYTKLCRMLIKHGHDPNEKGPDGRTAFEHALENGHVSLVDAMTKEVNRPPPGGRLIWIDAVCINQQDLSERSTQVQLMSRIYSEAKHVVVWLGTPDPLSRNGLEALAKLTLPLMDGTLLQSKIIPFAPYDQSKLFEDAGIENIDNTGWAGLASIFLRQYFRRIWSLQEAVLARSTVAFLGNTEVPWDLLLYLAHELTRMENKNEKSFSTRFRLHHGIHVEYEAEAIWQHRMRRQLDETTQERRERWFQQSNNAFSRGSGKRSQLPLLELVLASTTLECYDPRDRIYGLLGITGDHPESPRIIPDYTKPLPDLWAQVTRQYIERSDKPSKMLAILSYMRDTTLTSRSGLPSWVPDYGFVGSAVLGGGDFCADGDTGHTLQASDEWNLLTVRGIKVDTIDVSARERDRSLKVTKYDLDPSWFALVLKMDPIYHLTGQSRTEVLWRTLCGDRLAAPRQYPTSGTSPAPSRYGKQFTDLVCAMILGAQDAKAQAEGKGPALAPTTIALFTALSGLALAETENNSQPGPPSVTADQLTNFAMAASMDEDPLTRETINQLHQLAADDEESSRFTPTIQDIVAYARKPTYRLGQGTNVPPPHTGLSFMALDRNDGGFVERFSALYGYRRLYLTETRLLGLGPASLEVGDEVWVLAGAQAPLVLRPIKTEPTKKTAADDDDDDDDDNNNNNSRPSAGGGGGGGVDQRYRLVGETYLHGFMRGEAVSRANGEFTTIVLE